MSAKKNRIETRTLLYILIIILIVAGIAYFVFTYEPSTVLTVPQVNTPNNQYIGENIEVSGVYYSEEEDYLIANYITDANPTPTDMLRLNLSKIGNESRPDEGQQYTVKGLLTENQYGFIELRATKIDKK